MSCILRALCHTAVQTKQKLSKTDHHNLLVFKQSNEAANLAAGTNKTNKTKTKTNKKQKNKKKRTVSPIQTTALA
jgi:hypothetical protein